MSTNKHTSGTLFLRVLEVKVSNLSGVKSRSGMDLGEGTEIMKLLPKK